ncbi:MAG TPA: ATP-binding protein [Gaiellaceae bacterium]|nr:ATP-binding protein [Gaiellaceae bacterium]
MKRRAVTIVATVAFFATFGVMAGFSWTSELGAIAFSPWVALIGFESGTWWGVAAAALATGAWRLATEISGVPTTTQQLVVRATSFVLLGAGTAVAGRRLRESKRAHESTTALQSALIDSTLDGISLTDSEGNILIMNAPIVRMGMELGMPIDGTVPERLLAIADKVTAPERYRRRVLELASNPSEPTSDEFELAESGRVFRGYAAPVTDRSGRFVGRIWTLREVTADRELDRMRDAFVATVSHELRTPLTSIAGFVEMMQSEEEGMSEDARTYLRVIGRSSERLQHLVEDLLLMAQIEARRLELNWEPTDVGALAQLAVESARPVAAAREVTIDIETDGAPEIRADPGRIAQVLDNLVSNAVKFTPKGGSVSVVVDSDENAARLVVSDSGFGIPADEQDLVFSRFFRARNAMENAIPGTGLGLAITKALVERHGGHITLASEEDGGTRVTVTLPV